MPDGRHHCSHQMDGSCEERTEDCPGKQQIDVKTMTEMSKSVQNGQKLSNELIKLIIFD